MCIFYFEPLNRFLIDYNCDKCRDIAPIKLRRLIKICKFKNLIQKDIEDLNNKEKEIQKLIDE